MHRRLPHPFRTRDRPAGYRYRPSIVQAEFSLAQVLEAIMGRILLETTRENHYIGRPAKSVWSSTARPATAPGHFPTGGVVPSLRRPHKAASKRKP